MRPGDGFGVELTCNVMANPKADVTWYHNHKLIKRKSLYTVKTLDSCESRASGFFKLEEESNDNLIICRPNHKEHTGTYECQAKNTLGTDRKSLHLDILGK